MTYVIIVLNHNLGIYSHSLAKGWELQTIKGEVWSSIHNAERLVEILQQLNKDINHSKDLESVNIVVIYEQSQVGMLRDLSTCLTGLSCGQWQAWDWGPLLQRAELIELCVTQEHGGLPTDAWLHSVFLPGVLPLMGAQSFSDEKLHQIAKKNHEDTIESLREERRQLEWQLQQLQQQIQAVKQPEINQLMAFLPVIYRNFWTKVKPSDLAILAGSPLNIPEVQSPYSEPDANTIAIMAKRYKHLPVHHKQALLDFCEQSQLRLDVRREMQFIFDEGQA